MIKKIIIISIIVLILIMGAGTFYLTSTSEGTIMKDKLREYMAQTVQVFADKEIAKETPSQSSGLIHDMPDEWNTNRTPSPYDQPKVWSYNIMEEDMFLNATVIQVDENTLEFTFQEKEVIPPSYEWYLAVCDVGDDIQTREEASKIWTESTILTKQEFSKTSLPPEWCKDYAYEGYVIKSDGTKEEIANKYRITVPEDVYAFTLFAGNGSVAINLSTNYDPFAMWPSNVDSLIMDANGTLHAVYCASDNDLWYSRSYDIGATWEAKELKDWGCNHPGILVNSTDGIQIYWNWGDVFMVESINGGGFFGGDITMADTVNSLERTSCATDNNGNIHCCTADAGANNNFLYINSTQWNNEVTLWNPPSGNPSHTCDIEIDQAGNIHIVNADEGDDDDLTFWSSLTGLDEHSKTIVDSTISFPNTADEYGTIATWYDGSENHILLTGIESDDLQLYIGNVTSYQSNNATAFMQIELDGNPSYHPDISMDDNGTAHIVYSDDLGAISTSSLMRYINGTYPWTTWSTPRDIPDSSPGASVPNTAQSNYATDRNNISSILHYAYVDGNGDVWYNNFSVPAPEAAAGDTLPQFASETEDPADPNTYSSTQEYVFNATVTDDVQIDTVVLTFNNTNYSSALGELTNLSDVYSFNWTGLAAATYNYIWNANDSAGQTNLTQTFTYTVSRAAAGTHLLLNGTSANFTVEIGNNVNMTAERVTGEVGIEILNEGTILGIEGLNTSSITNTTNFTEIGAFNITSFIRESENFTDNFTTYYVNVIDNSTPIVTLVSPTDNNVTISGDVVFNSSAIDNIGLFNATLYHNLTGTFALNQSSNVSGTFNTTEFTINDITDTLFIWNVLYCDNSSNCAFANANWTVNVTLPPDDTTPPSIGSLTEDPSDPATYSLTQEYTFNATITDNVQVEEVIITFNNTNYSSAFGEVTNLSNVYSFNRTGLSAAIYNYTWNANDTSGNSALFPTANYTVNRAAGGTHLLLNGTSANFTVEIGNNVNMTADRIFGEIAIQLFNEAIVLAIEGLNTSSITNTTNFTEIDVFNITSFIRQSENFTDNFTTHYIHVIDNSTPIVTLLDPADNNLTTTGDVMFNSSAIDAIGLFNATLYHNLSGTFLFNQSTNVSGIFNITNFTINNIEADSFFSWNVLYCDNSSNCAFATANRSINVTLPREVDTEAPIVNLTSPPDNNISITGNITFESNATDNVFLFNATLFHNLTGTFAPNASVHVNGTFNETSFSINHLNDTAFFWNVLYCDNSSNCAFAGANWTISVNLTLPTPPLEFNLTNLTLYGEMFRRDDATVTIAVPLADTWYNITELEAGLLNGVTFNGNETLTVLQGGIFRVDYGISFSGGAGHEYEFMIMADGVLQNQTKSQRKLGGADIGNTGSTGLLNLTDNAQIQLVFQDIGAATDLQYVAVDVNLHKLNPDISGIIRGIGGTFWEIAVILAVFLTMVITTYNFTLLGGGKSANRGIGEQDD